MALNLKFSSFMWAFGKLRGLWLASKEERVGSYIIILNIFMLLRFFATKHLVTNKRSKFLTVRTVEEV